MKQLRIMKFLRVWLSMSVVLIVIVGVVLLLLTTFSAKRLTSAPRDRNADVFKLVPSSISTTAQQRRFIRGMMQHAWKGYVEHAFGWNEVAPQRKGIHAPSIYGGAKLGATIVDALDTLWIMGLRDEFSAGREWVVNNFDLSDKDAVVTVFEINIRFLGGLLSAYSLSGDEALLRKAYELGQTLLAAFNTPTGLPSSRFNFKRNQSSYERTVPLAECGTLHLEFAYLSSLTNDGRFLAAVNRIRQLLDKIDKQNGLYLTHLNIQTGAWDDEMLTSLGAMGDSFYEYLFKGWLLSNKTDSVGKRMFDLAMQAVENKLIFTSNSKHVYIGQIRNGVPMHKMEHFACFMGGIYALSAPYAVNPTLYALRGAQIADTCHFMYISTRTGLAAEAVSFQPSGVDGRAWGNERNFLLRPETVETYFVLWRKTKDPVYRQWGWDVARAIETHCRAEAGYAGLLDVYVANPSLQDDVQQSFFLAETLKYLYLLFVDENDDGTSTAADDGGVNISLDDYVFNTEAHPLPIYGSRYFPKVAKNFTNRSHD